LNGKIKKLVWDVKILYNGGSNIRGVHVKKSFRRTPRDYDGTEVTAHNLCDILPSVLAEVSSSYRDRPDLILAAWPDIIGAKLAPMTQAQSCRDGVLTVKVKNSTLHSLLSRHEKNKLLAKLRQKFPKADIQNIVFRIG
jgi:hypothetical protein